MDAAAAPRPAALKWVVALVVVGFVLLVGLVLAQLGRFNQLQSREEGRIETLLSETRPLPPPSPPADEAPALRRRVKELEAQVERLQAAPSPAPKTVEDKTLRFRGEEIAARMAAGLREFRAGRYAAAEANFFRAIPDSFVHLAVADFVRADYPGAIGFIAAARAHDPAWFRRLNPRTLFVGSPEEFEKHLRALEEAVRRDPLDAAAKTLLAFLYYHEKGAGYAKALLIEALAADPDHAEAKAFLEGLDK